MIMPRLPDMATSVVPGRNRQFQLWDWFRSQRSASAHAIRVIFAQVVAADNAVIFKQHRVDLRDRTRARHDELFEEGQLRVDTVPGISAILSAA